MQKSAIYRKKECDLCKNYCFEKHLGTAQILDGGFTRIEDWEPSGYGSMVVVWHGIKQDRIDLHLCPSCAAKLEKAIQTAIKELYKEAE